MNASRREIIEAYHIVRQTPGEGSVAFRIARMLGRKVNKNKSNSFVAKVLNEYRKM